MWLAIAHGSDEMHIVPQNDLIEHTESDECVCGPAVTIHDDGMTMVTHASLDGRESKGHVWRGY